MRKPIKIKSIPSAMETLRSMEVYQTSEIPFSKIDTGNVRTAVSRLNKEGFQYVCSRTAKGLDVTRLK